MSKSSTILAGLGVVAALGMAALPLSSYAADGASVNGNVTLNVTITEAIAMQIKSNNDGDTAGTHVQDPTGSIDTTWGDDAQNSSASIEMVPNNTNATMNSLVTVYTNANAFTLSLAAKDDETSLVGSQTSGEIETASGQILGTGESAVVSGKRVSAWGYYVGSSAGTSTTFVDVKESDSADTLQTGNLTSGKSETTVYYGVSTGPDLAPDTYTGGVTYTATTANS